MFLSHLLSCFSVLVIALTPWFTPLLLSTLPMSEELHQESPAPPSLSRRGQVELPGRRQFSGILYRASVGGGWSLNLLPDVTLMDQWRSDLPGTSVTERQSLHFGSCLPANVKTNFEGGGFSISHLVSKAEL